MKLSFNSISIASPEKLDIQALVEFPGISVVVELFVMDRVFIIIPLSPRGIEESEAVIFRNLGERLIQQNPIVWSSKQI